MANLRMTKKELPQGGEHSERERIVTIRPMAVEVKEEKT